ncbi:hypothetical protein [Streptomyces lavendofoliae]|uniref:hypothetical protein n=1 Tax=Streptomyces lavendofoliae TaxID=67314 RepID=UPI003D9213C7
MLLDLLTNIVRAMSFPERGKTGWCPLPRVLPVPPAHPLAGRLASPLDPYNDEEVPRLALADPDRAADELAYAHQLLTGLDQRSNTLLAQVTALIKDAGTSDVTTRAESLQADIEAAGLPFLHRFVELALAFHYAVRGEDQALAATIGRLRELTATGDFAYFTDIADFMVGLLLPESSTTRWTTREDDVRVAWRGLVQARQEHLLAGS